VIGGVSVFIPWEIQKVVLSGIHACDTWRLKDMTGSMGSIITGGFLSLWQSKTAKIRYRFEIYCKILSFKGWLVWLHR